MRQLNTGKLHTDKNQSFLLHIIFEFDVSYLSSVTREMQCVLESILGFDARMHGLSKSSSEKTFREGFFCAISDVCLLGNVLSCDNINYLISMFA